MATQLFTVTGMTCGHCVAAVTDEIGQLPGITHVSVALEPGETSVVTVDAEADLDIEAVRRAVDEAGYELVG